MNIKISLMVIEKKKKKKKKKNSFAATWTTGWRKRFRRWKSWMVGCRSYPSAEANWLGDKRKAVERWFWKWLPRCNSSCCFNCEAPATSSTSNVNVWVSKAKHQTFFKSKTNLIDFYPIGCDMAEDSKSRHRYWHLLSNQSIGKPFKWPPSFYRSSDGLSAQIIQLIPWHFVILLTSSLATGSLSLSLDFPVQSHQIDKEPPHIHIHFHFNYQI